MTGRPARSGGEVVRLEGIRKRFGPVVAARDVSLALPAGEVHALLGENGAGKTTLMNVLFGLVTPDAGSIVVRGETVTGHWSPRRAIAHGIGMIHQHFSLVLEHTVLENVVLPVLRWRDVRPDWRRHRAAVAALGEGHGFALALDAPVGTLSVGQRQQVEILKMLYQGAEVLILDEPTGVLTPQQTRTLLDMLARLGAQGHTVVLITHKLREALAVSDRITVLRQGAHVGTLARAEARPDVVVRMMVGQEWVPSVRPAPPPRTQPVLEIADLVVPGPAGDTVRGVSLAVRAGEIVGIAGVAGNGQTELAEAVVGYRPVAAGGVRIGGEDITAASIRTRQRRGLSFIPEDRRDLGLVLDMTVSENLVLDRAGEPPFSRRGVLDVAAVRAWGRAQVERYDIRTPSSEVPVATLSGGNQQKVVLGRALSRRPRVIVACEPSRGLDFGATEDVRRRLIESAAEGIGVLLVSSDLEELMQLCHRVAVMYRGRLAGELGEGEYDLQRFGLLMTGLGA